MFPIKIGDKIYVHPFHVASKKGIWKYYDNSDDESDCESVVDKEKENVEGKEKDVGNSVFVGDGWEEIY